MIRYYIAITLWSNKWQLLKGRIFPLNKRRRVITHFHEIYTGLLGIILVLIIKELGKIKNSLQDKLLNVQALGSNFGKFLVRYCWPLEMIFTGLKTIIQALAAWPVSKREDCKALTMDWHSVIKRKYFFSFICALL